MSEDTENRQEHEQETSERVQSDDPVHNEQAASLHTDAAKMDEEQSETGEGVLDHAEHSDAPGPFGTS